MHFLTSIQYCYEYTVNQISLGLLSYSHGPTALISLFFGGYILWREKSRVSLTLFIVCISFALWCLADLVSWFSFVGSQNVMFAWSLLDLIALMMFFFAYHFLYSFITGKDLPSWQKFIAFVVILPTGVWTFLGKNLSLYDANNCTAIENNEIVRYPYLVETLFIVASFVLILYSLRKSGSQKKKEILLAGGGVLTFLIFFFSSTFLVNILSTEDTSSYAYNYEIYGLFGMPILLGFLAFIIVRYKKFNIKAFGAQILVLALIALIGSQFFYAVDGTSIILTSVTLVITGIIGINLIRSVKKEIQAKEKITELASTLEQTNARLKELDQQKSEFISLASHQIRGPLTSIKGYVSMILEGDFGKITDQLKETMETIYTSTQSLVVLVGDFLDVSRIEQGRMRYDYVDFNLKELVDTVVREITPTVNIEKLQLTFNSDNKKDYMVHADQGKIKQVVLNIIDNAIKYTKEGFIKVSLTRNKNKFLIEIKDSGVGIKPEVLPKLFEKFTRAPDASKTNILGTGLGLYVAKKMVENHQGRIWAESEGEGKGSRFYVELNTLNKDPEEDLPEDMKDFAQDL